MLPRIIFLKCFCYIYPIKKLSQYTIAVFIFLTAYPLWSSANKAMDSLYQKAQQSFEVGNYAMNLEYTLKALELAETCSDKAAANFKVGGSYYHLQQKTMAISYFAEAHTIAANCNDSVLWITARVLGSTYLELGKRDSSIYYLKKAEALLLKTTNWRGLGMLYAIFGEVYRKDKGKYYFDLSEQYAIKANDTIVRAFANVKQGSLASEINECVEAEKYLQKALALYRKKHYVEGEMYALIIMARSYRNCGDALKTYEAMNKYAALRDSIFKKETANKTAHYHTLYETEKKERENSELVKNRRLLIACFVISLLLLSLGFLFFYSRYKLKKQKEIEQHKAEQEQQRFAAVIEAEENERKRIASDLHDGVGQTMSAAKINLSMLQNELQFKDDNQLHSFEKVVGLVDESCREVRSVSHSMMPNALLKSGLASAIKNFVNQIDHRALSVDFYSDGLNAPLNTNNEVVLYRVIQECVNNVIKHANATKLYISLIKDENEISVTIEDNGKGFDASKAENFEGIGLKNIQTRINYLKGTVEWDSAVRKGTVVTINIPST